MFFPCEIDSDRRLASPAGKPELDPAYASGTVTPEPGGLSTAQAFTLLEELGALPFAGMDCVVVRARPRPPGADLAGGRAEGLDLALRPRESDVVLTYFAIRKTGSPLQLFRGKDCCESRHRMRC